MKKNMKVGLLIMATGLVLASCASMDWDKSVPKEQAAVLHFGDGIMLVEVDGGKKAAEGALSFIATAFEGKGGVSHIKSGKKTTASDEKAKAIVRIPAGQHELTFEYKNPMPMAPRVRTKITHDFAPGRHYYFAIDYEKTEERGLQIGAAAQLELAKKGFFEANIWTIRDVTDEKWAKK